MSIGDMMVANVALFCVAELVKWIFVIFLESGIKYHNLNPIEHVFFH
jgi:hypothetical protein